MDLHGFYMGSVFDAYKFFGAHLQSDGVVFRVFAPNAAYVEVIGEFNNWQGQHMNREGSGGIHTVLIPNAYAGQMYKYRIHTRNGGFIDKTDPYGFATELRPNSASIITDLYAFKFTDGEWLAKRTKCYNTPMNIYELHMGSWLIPHAEEEGGDVDEFINCRDLAKPLISYVKEHGFTHIEVLPLAEHPADCSWGYQVTGFFSPTSRYGTPDDLKYFVNECHKAGIGVITDFVPVHFAVDGYSLVSFDGTPLYEYPNDGAGRSEWGTYNFNFYRGEVRSFMQSAANYWLSEFHFDGIRMDAISNILYWQGDANRGVNNGAVNFVRSMNDGLHKLHPTAVLMAEDSTNFLKVTAPAEYNGLGFDYKWDMGWMNDTLDFFRTPPAERPAHYHDITFSMQYFYNELFILPFSHDEVVHGKATIIQKMWGDYEVKFPQCRALYAYMFTHPGKKLNFMGNEIAMFREWDEKKEPDRFLLKYPAHDSFLLYFTDLSKLYLDEPALHNAEYNMDCFKWLEADAPDKCVYIYKRSAENRTVLVVLNFSDKEYKDFRVGVDGEYMVDELINSDTEKYGGHTPSCEAVHTNTEEIPYKKLPYSFTDTLAPFSAKIYSLKEYTKE